MKNWMRKIIGGVSLGSALFIFQACYGIEPDWEPDILVSGKVVSKTTGNPIPGIKVIADSEYQNCYTDSTGSFSMYIQLILDEGLTVQFMDVDSTLHGLFADKKILISNSSNRMPDGSRKPDKKIPFIHIELEEII